MGLGPEQQQLCTGCHQLFPRSSLRGGCCPACAAREARFPPPRAPEKPVVLDSPRQRNVPTSGSGDRGGWLILGLIFLLGGAAGMGVQFLKSPTPPTGDLIGGFTIGVILAPLVSVLLVKAWELLVYLVCDEGGRIVSLLIVLGAGAVWGLVHYEVIRLPFPDPGGLAGVWKSSDGVVLRLTETGDFVSEWSGEGQPPAIMEHIGQAGRW